MHVQLETSVSIDISDCDRLIIAQSLFHFMETGKVVVAVMMLHQDGMLSTRWVGPLSSAEIDALRERLKRNNAQVTDAFLGGPNYRWVWCFEENCLFRLKN